MTRDEIRTEMFAQFWRAKVQGRQHHEINAGELYRTINGSPMKEGDKAAVADCCGVLRNEFKKGEATIVFEPPKSVGLALTIRYNIPRPKSSGSGVQQSDIGVS